MGLLNAWPPVAAKTVLAKTVLAKTVLVAGTAVCVAAAFVAGVGGPALAQGTPGTVIEHWGAYNGGQIGDQQDSPVSLTLPAPVEQIGSSNSTQYALLTNGQVWAWGEGTDGELGNGTKENSYTTPVQVQFPSGVTIASIPTDVDPFNSAFAVDTTGQVWGWGVNAGGEFCLGNTKEYLTPVKLPLTGVTTLAGAANHATYDVGGTIYSCGSNTYGELGTGGTKSSTVPVPVKDLDGSAVTTLVASWGNTGALLSNGDYYDWGFDQAGQVGNGTEESGVTLPYEVPLRAGVSQVALGGSLNTNGASLALLSDGSLWAWGNGSLYQLGDGTTANEDSPIKITPPDGVTYAALASGGFSSYAISRSGAVWAWGANMNGQIGDGTTTKAKEPVKVATGAVQISATARDVVISTTQS
jgi:alpha-tubulin suppressor-like RCC1 family protein